MANSLPLKKGFATLLSFLVLLSAVGPSGLAVKIPTASAITITVSNLNDSGAGSLRQAILDANASVGVPDTIDFSVAGTINLASALPAVTDTTTISALAVTQLGANIVLNATGFTSGLLFNGTHSGSLVEGVGIIGAQRCFEVRNAATNVTLGTSHVEGGIEATGCTVAGIEFDSTGATIVNAYITGNQRGITLSNGSNATIGGLTTAERVYSSGNTEMGLSFQTWNTASVLGSYFGLNKDGVSDHGNTQNGITVDAASSNIVIGSSSAGGRNYISGNNQTGLVIQAAGTIVKGNCIGTNASCTGAVANSMGGVTVRASNVTVGGSTDAERNIISGNTTYGIMVDSGAGTVNNTVIQKNIIGLGSDGTTVVANTGSGITFGGGSSTNTLISVNVISGNGQNGVNVINSTGTSIQGNLIGLSLDGLSAKGNTNNGIFLNSGNASVGTTARNVISANNQNGIQILSTNNSIKGNCIGTTGTCTTDSNLVNNQAGVSIQGGASTNNSFGGDGAGESNVVHQKTGMLAINVNNTAGSGNRFAHNDFLNISAGGLIFSVASPGNGGVTNPVITSATRTSPTTVLLIGTTQANNRVDVYAGGLWAGSTTADGAGAFSITATSVATNYTVSSTTAGGSTSGTPAVVAETVDVTPPTAPTASPSNSSPLPGDNVTISGAGEANASVISNGIDTGIDTDGAGNYSYSVVALDGINTINTHLVDGMGNVGPDTTTVFTASAPSSGGGAAAAGAGAAAGHNAPSTPEPETGNVVDTETQTELDVGTEEEIPEGESLAGDVEVTDPVSSDPVSSDPGSSQSEAPQSATPAPQPVQPIKNIKPLKSFVDKVNEIAQPIKVKTIRESLGGELKGKPRLTDQVKKIKLFGPSTNEQGIPDKIIKIKFKGKNFTNEDLNLDPDGDGLTTGEELAYFYDPFEGDTDKDGINDLMEAFNGTDGSRADTDRDGKSDQVDPEPTIYNNPQDKHSEESILILAEAAGIDRSEFGTTDTDQDGLGDLYEVWLGTDTEDADTDNDGKTDGDEVQQYASDPLVEDTSSTENNGLVVANITPGETLSEQQFYSGTGPSNTLITFNAVDSEGGLIPIGDTWTDDRGFYNLLTTVELPAGTQTIVPYAGTEEDPVAFGAPFTIFVQKHVSNATYMSLNLRNGTMTPDSTPILDIRSGGAYMTTIAWRSTIYTQTLIADASDQIIYSEPEPLEEGPHTVTWYSVDPVDNLKSEPTQVAFTITNAAFVGGESGSNLWTIVLGSVAVLASLAALGLYFRKPKNTK